MKINFFTAIIFIASLVLLFGCKQSPYDKAVSYIDNLSTEITSVTTDAEYEEVYNKIVTLNSNEAMTNLTDLPQEQKREIAQKAIRLTQEALTVKAILYVMPKDVKPTTGDIVKLVNECLQKKLDILNSPYSDVSAMVKEYYRMN